MAVVAIYSVKGGVGKTTIAANLAWLSATISCRKTLLWDLDASGGAGFLLSITSRAKQSAGNAFFKDANPQDLICSTSYDRLDILLADRSLRALDTIFAQIGKKKRLAKVADAFGGSYERIILDCPPVLSETSAQVLRAADCVIVPLPPSPLSARALELVKEEVRSHGRSDTLMLPVLSMVDRRRLLHRQMRAEHADWPSIPLASVVEQCAVRQQPVGAFAPKSPAARGMGQLWTAIERKLARR